MAFVFSGPDFGELYRSGLATQGAQAQLGTQLRAQDIAANQFWNQLAQHRVDRNQAINAANTASAENAALFRFSQADAARREAANTDWQNRLFKLDKEKFDFQKDYADKSLKFTQEENRLKQEAAESAVNFQNATTMAMQGTEPEKIFSMFKSLDPTQRDVVTTQYGLALKGFDEFDNRTKANLSAIKSLQAGMKAAGTYNEDEFIKTTPLRFGGPRDPFYDRFEWDQDSREFVPKFKHPQNIKSMGERPKTPPPDASTKSGGWLGKVFNFGKDSLRSMIPSGTGEKAGQAAVTVMDLLTPDTENPSTIFPTVNLYRKTKELFGSEPVEPMVTIQTASGPKIVRQSDALKLAEAWSSMTNSVQKAIR